MKTGNVIQPIIWVLGLGCFLAPLAAQAPSTGSGWRDVTRELGIASPERLPLSGRSRLTETFRGRAVSFDFDRDGDLDLLLTYGPHAADSLYSGLNRLYRQDDTAWVDVTAETGLARFPPASNAVVGDVDGDGYLDLYLCRFGSDRLLHNDGGQRWYDVTDSVGLTNEYWSTEAVFFDANRDGYLDLYVANYLAYPSEDTLVCFDPETRRPTYCDPLMYEPAPNRLFLNDSGRGFHEMTAAMGLADTTSRSLAVQLLDANSDGYLDLFVLSHRSPNLLYRGGIDSGFAEAGLFSGVALAPDGSEPEWSQVLPLDADQDGHTDLLFTRRDGELLLLLNDGHGLFFEGHYQTGLFQPRFPYRATTAVALDLDFSGTVDLLLADTRQEHVRDTPMPDTPAPDTAMVDSAAMAQDSSVAAAQDSSFASAIDSSLAIIQPSSMAQAQDSSVVGARIESRRILLSDEAHHFQAVVGEVPMILDTTMLIPRAAEVAVPDTILDFLLGEALGPLAFPRAPEEEPALADTALVPTAELPAYMELDTLRVGQEAERYVVVDLTGDGVEEVIATYPVGLFRIWQREPDKEPRFVGLWPQTDRPGTTAIGAELLVTSPSGEGFSRRYIVTGPNPIVLYFPRRVWSLEVEVKWPDGLENRYRATLLNRIYTLTRVEREP